MPVVAVVSVLNRLGFLAIHEGARVLQHRGCSALGQTLLLAHQRLGLAAGHLEWLLRRALFAGVVQNLDGLPDVWGHGLLHALLQHLLLLLAQRYSCQFRTLTGSLAFALLNGVLLALD